MTPEIKAGLAFIDGLNQKEESAFLGLFAGARMPDRIFEGQDPSFGKAECEWVEDWRDFYSRRLVEAGLFFWEEGESGPALGMIKKANGEHHSWTKINCGPTDLGFNVREAWWDRWQKNVEALDQRAKAE